MNALSGADYLFLCTALCIKLNWCDKNDVCERGREREREEKCVIKSNIYCTLRDTDAMGIIH